MNSKSKTSPISSDRDHRLLFKIARADIERHLSALLDLHRNDSHHAIFPFEQTRIIRDFSKLPPSLSFGLLDTTRQGERHISDTIAQMHKAGDSNAPAISVVYSLEDGVVSLNVVEHVDRELRPRFDCKKRAACTDSTGAPLQSHADDIDKIVCQVEELAGLDRLRDTYLWDLERVNQAVAKHFSKITLLTRNLG